MTAQRTRHVSEVIDRLYEVQGEFEALDRRRAELVDELRGMFPEVDPATVDAAAIRELYWAGSPQVRVSDIVVAMGEPATSPLVPHLHRQAGPGEFHVKCQDCGQSATLVTKSRAQPVLVSRHRCDECIAARHRAHDRHMRQVHDQEKAAAIQYLASNPRLPDIPETGDLYITFLVPDSGYATWDVQALHALRAELASAFGVP